METTLTLKDTVPLSESRRFLFNSERLLRSNYKSNVDKDYEDANLK